MSAPRGVMHLVHGHDQHVLLASNMCRRGVRGRSARRGAAGCEHVVCEHVACEHVVGEHSYKCIYTYVLTDTYIQILMCI